MPRFFSPFPLSVFLSFSLLLLYRDIEADRSTLKPHFTPSNYTPKWHRAFPFFLSFRVSLVSFSRSRLPLLFPVYFRAVPPFVFIRAIGKGGSFESLLSFLVFHGPMLPDQRLVATTRIYLGTPRDASQVRAGGE